MDKEGYVFIQELPGERGSKKSKQPASQQFLCRGNDNIKESIRGRVDRRKKDRKVKKRKLLPRK